jgi:hypothetical protein
MSAPMSFQKEAAYVPRASPSRNRSTAAAPARDARVVASGEARATNAVLAVVGVADARAAPLSRSRSRVRDRS